MSGQGGWQVAWRLGLLAAGMVSTAMSPAPSSAQPSRSTPTMHEDAALADVFFLDPDRGWAVGDRGVIWATDDGGRHWRLQASGVDCRLESVHFVDDHRGWAVGGWTHPYTHGTSAVVLATADGGQSWKPLEAEILPALRAVRFQDARRGWAIGASSPLHPAGVFQTSDGGLSWSSVPTTVSGHWTAGDMTSGGEPLVANRDGQIWRLSLTQPQLAQTPPLIAQPVRELRMSSSSDGWLVGDRGLVLHTRDGGRSWDESPLPLPPEVVRQCAWQTVAVFGQHCWIAGTPGSVILHSRDGGSRWEVLRTGQALPLHAMQFLDEHRGWAVGSLGTILATRDGGRSWRVQRSGGQRVALLGLYSEAPHVPLELIALSAAEEGLLTAVELVTRRGVELPELSESSAESRTREAMIGIGASAASVWCDFPLRQQGLPLPLSRTLESWQPLHGDRARERLEQAIALRIRQWRPDVITTEPLQLVDQGTLQHLINQAVLAAVERAGDASYYPEQIDQLGLGPWSVKKVFSTGDDEQRGASILVTSRLAINLGRSLADYSSIARGLIHDQYQVPPTSLGFRLMVNRLPQVSDHRDLFTGLNLAFGGEARRARGVPASGNPGDLARVAQKQRNVQQILARTTHTTHGGAAWLGQIDELLRGLDEENCGEILIQLARQYANEGRWQLAAEVHLLMVGRYPNHELAPSALMWLVQFGSSAEVAHMIAAQSPAKLADDREQPVRAASTTSAAVQPATYEAPFGPNMVLGPGASAILAPATNAPREPAATIDPEGARRHVVQLGREIQQRRPALFADPRIRFPLAAAQRDQGLLQDSQAAMQTLARGGANDGWATRARAELWLKHRRGDAPGKVARPVAAKTKPRLDGQLNDDVWRQATRLELRSVLFDDTDWPAKVMFAYDDEFLYIAVQCYKVEGVDYSFVDAPRPRDGDLSNRDRIDLLLDVDRDGMTYFRLTVDHRGWTGEACWDRPGWNPQWFVAAAEDDRTWTVEVALPREELTNQPIQSGDAWALGVQRVVPGVGFQSWTEPAAIVVRPEGFGLLMFD